MEVSHKALLSSMRSLPKEIQDMILKALIRALLQPGRVCLGDPESNRKVPDNALAIRPGVIEALDIQDVQLRSLARDIFYTQNTWVIAEGPFATVEFLIWFPGPAMFDISRIVSVDFSFSWQDNDWSLEDEAIFRRRQRQPWYSKLLHGNSAHNAHLQQAYDVIYQNWATNLQRTWWRKFFLVSCLPLHHLRLDFRRCWDPRGNFRGLEVASSNGMTIFRHGLPPHLEIVAHNPAIEAQILHLIQQANTFQQFIECSLCIDGLHPKD